MASTSGAVPTFGSGGLVPIAERLDGRRIATLDAYFRIVRLALCEALELLPSG